MPSCGCSPVLPAQRVHECSNEYAVVWRTGDGPASSGKLELGADNLVLHGSSEDELRIPFDQLRSVEIGRAAGERINGDRSLVLERHSCERVLVAALGGVGLLGELTDLLARLRAEHAARACVAVVVPIRRGSADAARRLVEEGPPFDPERLGLERHHVFVSEREVVFFFEGDSAGAAVDALSRNPRVLNTAVTLAGHSRRPAATRRGAVWLDAAELTNSSQPSSEAETDPAPRARLARRLAKAEHPRRPLVLDDWEVVEPVLGHHGHCRLDRRGG